VDGDTIAAIATPPGRGGVGIVRVSGPQAAGIAGALLGVVPAPRYAHFAVFRARDGDALDSGLALYFARPKSFTGEDVLELHCHGGPVVLDRVLRETLRLGARLARPGEFSQRAFLNNKIDLAEAEAIADLIDCASEDAARLAVRSLQGEFSARINATVQRLVQLRTALEAGIDFPDEDVDHRSHDQLRRVLADSIERVQRTFDAARQGAVLREGMTVVIAGAPNVGKSTLLNRLAGKDVAIVTDIPGTTRDVLRAEITLDGLPLHIIDTAGLRDSADPVEQEGIRRARQQIQQADVVLLLTDDSKRDSTDSEDILAHLGTPRRMTRVSTKIDLTGHAAGEVAQAHFAISATTGAGIEALREHLKECAGFRGASEGAFLARRRHLDALQRALACLTHAHQQFSADPPLELLAEDLRIAQQHLGEITGEFTSDDLLGEIFATFCIGK
jgi:tRNA modification GTPase